MFARGAACVGAGATKLVDEVVEELAASASVAPPTAAAATAAPVISVDLMFGISLL
jgi:hypothetical protein